MSKPSDAPGGGDALPPDLQQPSRIGPFRILDVLGEGGMAVVYLAEQTEPVQRQVALKIVKPGMDSQQVAARFETERQALAVLDHPNIAKVFDGGITENGRPYFVMERVKGLPVTDYCDDYKLDTRARLELFIEICSAVQHAHNKGLIHRDLKPSNILVGDSGGQPQPRIIDFGIAKATTVTLTDKTLYTRLGQVVGTPQYMSPEQADTSGLDVDTRSDIFSLGVVLYEMLVGVVPMDTTGLNDQSMRSALLEKQATKPSTRVTALGDTGVEIARARGTSPDVLRRLLKGDLDWVVMKAIAPDRARRYETVNALAMDCRRFLRHEPVLARPPSAGYLLSRFIRRNRTAVVAMGLVFATLVVGVVGTSWGMLRAIRAEQRAEQEASIARAVNEFLNADLLAAVAPSTQRGRGREVPMREVLDVAAQRIEEAAVDGGRFAGTPRVEAAIRTTLGNTYGSLGELAAAEPHLRRALALYRLHPGEQGDDLANALSNLASLFLKLGQYENAAAYHQEALAVWTPAHGENNDNAISWLNSQAIALGRLGRSEEAESQFQRALQLATTTFGKGSVETLKPLVSLASFYQELGEAAKAEAALVEAMAIHERQPGPPSVFMIKTMNNLGNVYANMGRYADAMALWNRSLELKRTVMGPEHPSTLNTIANLGDMAEILGHYDRAEPLFRQVIDARSRVLGETHPRTLRSRSRLAFVLARTGRAVEAEAQVRDVIESFIDTLGPEHAYTLEAEDILATALTAQGRLDEAEAILRRVRATFESAHSQDAYSRNIVAAHLGLLLARRDRREQAVAVWREIDAAKQPGAGQTQEVLRDIVEYLDQWQRSDPNGAYGEDAVTWRSRLAQVQTD